MTSPLEEDEQATFVEWLELKGLKFTALTQDTYTKSWKQKARTKKLGVRTGFPDMAIVVPGDSRRPPALAFVEMKRTKSKLRTGSPLTDWKPGQQAKGGLRLAQKEWILQLNEIPNVECTVAYGAEEAIAFITSIL